MIALAVVVLFALVVSLALVGLYIYKKRDTTGEKLLPILHFLSACCRPQLTLTITYRSLFLEPVYQDVPLRSKGDANYETLQKARGRESEYDTLNPEASGGERKGGEYEALKKEGMQEGVYHSLGAQGAAGGDGGYEALKKEGMKDGEYQTLKTEEAVKKPDEELEIVEG